MNLNVKPIIEDSVDQITGICIAIARFDLGIEQQHIGFLYRDGDNLTKLLHLAWHYILKKEDPSKVYLWMEIPFDELNQINTAAFLESIYDSNPDGIPYGICIDGTRFEADGAFFFLEKGAGLTCATFVMQVFQHLGYNIIDKDCWEFRDSDKEWQNQIIDDLENYGAPKEYITYQRNKIQGGVARFKPEEVAVASVLSSPPYALKDIIEPSQNLLELIVAHAKKLASEKN